MEPDRRGIVGAVEEAVMGRGQQPLRRCALRVVGATGPVEELLSRFRRYLELERGVVPAAALAIQPVRTVKRARNGRTFSTVIRQP